jgi:hypothetical protein
VLDIYQGEERVSSRARSVTPIEEDVVVDNRDLMTEYAARSAALATTTTTTAAPPAAAVAEEVRVTLRGRVVNTLKRYS